MKNQKGYSMIEVIVAITVFSILFIPITMGILEGIKLHLTARTHLDYLYKSQAKIEEERYSNHSTDETVTGNYQRITKYTLVTSGNQGETIPLTNAKNLHYTDEFTLSYDGLTIEIEGEKIVLGGSSNTITLLVKQVGSDKKVEIDYYKNGTPMGKFTKTVLDDKDSLNIHFGISGTTSTSPSAVVEFANELLLGNDLIVSVEPDPDSRIIVQSKRMSTTSGEVFIYENVVDHGEVVTEDLKNENKLYQLDVETKRTELNDEYTIQETKTMQENH